MSGVTVGGAVAYYVWNRLERITTTERPEPQGGRQATRPGHRPGHGARGRARPRLRQALRLGQREGPFGHADADARRPADEGALAALAAARPVRPHPASARARSTTPTPRGRAARDQDGEPGARRQDQLLRAGRLPPLPQDGRHLPRRLHRRRPALLHVNNGVQRLLRDQPQAGLPAAVRLPGAASTSATATSTPTSSARRASRPSCASSSAAST